MITSIQRHCVHRSGMSRYHLFVVVHVIDRIRCNAFIEPIVAETVSFHPFTSTVQVARTRHARGSNSITSSYAPRIRNNLAILRRLAAVTLSGIWRARVSSIPVSNHSCVYLFQS